MNLLKAVPISASKPDYPRLDPLKTPALTSLGSSRSTGLGLPHSNTKSLVDSPRQLTNPLSLHISTRPGCGWDFWLVKLDNFIDSSYFSINMYTMEQSSNIPVPIAP